MLVHFIGNEAYQVVKSRVCRITALLYLISNLLEGCAQSFGFIDRRAKGVDHIATDFVFVHDAAPVRIIRQLAELIGVVFHSFSLKMLAMRIRVSAMLVSASVIPMSEMQTGVVSITRPPCESRLGVGGGFLLRDQSDHFGEEGSASSQRIASRRVRHHHRNA